MSSTGWVQRIFKSSDVPDPTVPNTGGDEEFSFDGDSFLGRLPGSVRGRLLQKLKRFNFKAGNSLPEIERVNGYIVAVLSGRIRATYLYPDLFGSFTRKHAPGDVLQALEVVVRTNALIDVTPTTDTTIGIIKIDEFKELLKSEPELAMEILSAVGVEYSERAHRFPTITGREKRLRLRLAMLHHALPEALLQDGVIIDPTPPYQILGQSVDCHHETVSQEIKSLQKNGIIERKGKATKIVDLKGFLSTFY